MTTVGFGEIFPNTHPGRFIGVIACISGMVIISLWVLSLSNTSDFSSRGKKGFSTLKRIHVEKEDRDNAADVIKMTLRLAQVKAHARKDVTSSINQWIWKLKLIRQISIFGKRVRTIHPHNLNPDEMLANLQDKIASDYKDIYHESHNLRKINESVKRIEHQNRTNTGKIREVVKMQKSIAEMMIKMTNATLTKSSLSDKS